MDAEKMQVLPSGEIVPVMALRDYFAAAALSSCSSDDFRDDASCAKWCYAIADALLAARDAKALAPERASDG